MLMKNRRKDIIYMFIASLAFSVLMAAVFIIFEQKEKLYLAIIPQVVLAAFIWVMYLLEKAVNKEAELLKNSDNTYKVDLTELQLEYVCDEFTRHGVKLIKQ